MRNFAALYPDGLPDDSRQVPGGNVRIANGRVVTTTVEDRAADAPPWLTGGVAALRYLASPDAQPWVPTLGELEDARDAAAVVPGPEVGDDGVRRVRSLEIGGARERAITRKLPPLQTEPSSRPQPGEAGQPW